MADYNFSIFVVASLSLIPLCTAAGIMTRQFIKNRYTHELYLSIALIFVVFSTLFQSLAYFFTSTQFFWVYLFFWIPPGFFIILTLDAMSRETVEIVKFSFISLISLATFISLLLDPVTIQTLGDGTQRFVVPPSISALLPLLNLAQGIPLVFLFIQIHRNAPGIVKNYSRFSLVGSFVMTCGPLATITGLYLFIPGIYTMCLGIGVLLIVWGLNREPRQAYVLPFKLLRLLVFKTESGLPLYSHTWQAGTNLSDEDLFSAMIQGVTMLMKESIKQGELRTIELERAVLLVRREISRGIACVLVSTKKSRLLQESLQKFLNLFAQRFSNARPELIDQDLYRDAKGLILQCFPFVPE